MNILTRLGYIDSQIIELGNIGGAIQKKKCSKCHIAKSAGEFHRNRATQDGLAGWCQDCVRRAQQAHRVEVADRKRQRGGWQDVSIVCDDFDPSLDEFEEEED